MPSSGGGTLDPISSPAPSAVTPLVFPVHNLLPLESFREILGYNPFHFWGLANSSVPQESSANTIIRKYAWQDADAASRENMIEAIIRAETQLKDYLGYSVAPRYTEATIPWPKYNDVTAMRLNGASGPSGRRLSLKLPEGYVQAVGVLERTLLGTPNVAYSDQDGDGLNDSFSLSIATSITNPALLGIYIASADRLDGDAVGEDYRIAPVKITFSGGTATIRGKAWQLVKPIKYISYDPNAAPLDPSNAANFVTTLEVYSMATDTDGETVDDAQGVLLWETTTCGYDYCLCGSCNGITYVPTDSSYDPAAIGKAVARVGIRDSQSGLIIPAQATRDATSGIWYSINWSLYREPDRVTVRYLAGHPLDQNGFMDRKWRMIVARLAMAELERRISAADVASRVLHHWQFDLARAAGANDEQYAISPADLENPFGTLRGQVYAWKQVKNLRLLSGLSMAL